jgi:hypothetical protein
MERNQAEWREHYLAALQEFDPKRLSTLVEMTETSIFFRFQALAISGNGHVERQEIANAAHTLLALKQDVLKFPSI